MTIKNMAFSLCFFLMVGAAVGFTETENITSATTVTLPIVTFNLTQENYAGYFPKLALALSGGSAKGISYIGMLKVLEDQHIPVNSIAGTSIGSLVGSLYACGYTADEIEHLFKTIDYEKAFDDLVRDKPAAFSRGSLDEPTLIRIPEESPVGLTSGQNLQSLLRKYTLLSSYDAGLSFDKLPRRLRVVATDFLTGEKVVFRSGQIDRAVRASTSIPYIFKPFPYKKTYLIDGGASEIIPIDEAREMQPDVVVAINVARTPELTRDEARSFSSYSLHLFDVLVNTTIDKNLAKTDVFIDVPPSENLGGGDYAKVDEFIDYGSTIMKSKLTEIYTMMLARSQSSPKYRLSRITLDHSSTFRFGPLLEGREYYLWEIMRELYPPLASDEIQNIDVMLTPQADGSYALDAKLVQYNPIKTVTWAGNSIHFHDDIEQLLLGFVGRPFSDTTKRDMIETVKDFYREQGFILVNVLPVYADGEVQLQITEVPIVKVSFEGNTFTSSEVIESVLKIKTSEPYNANKVDQAVQQLYATELFEYIEPEIIPVDDGVELKFNLVERPYGVFYANAQYFSPEERVELDVGHKNNYTFGYHIKSYLRGVIGPRTDINFGFSRYDILNTGLGVGIDYLRREEDLKLFTEHEYDATVANDLEDRSIYLEYWFLNYTIAQLAYTSRSRYIHEEDEAVLQDHSRDLAVTEFDLKWDTLEKDLLASRGGNCLIHIEQEQVRDLSKKNLTSTIAFPLYKRSSLAVKTNVGIASGTRTALDNFYLRRKWLPYGYSDFEAGGENVWYNRISWRFPLGDMFRGEVGADLFRSWEEKASGISSFENIGFGLAFHYPSFLGLASAGYGVRNDGNAVWTLFISNEFEE